MDKVEFLKLVRAKMQARREARERPESVKALLGLPIHARPKNFADKVRGELGRLEKDHNAAKREGDAGAAGILRRRINELQKMLQQHEAYRQTELLREQYEAAKKQALQEKTKQQGWQTLDSVEEGMRRLGLGGTHLRTLMEMLGPDLDQRIVIPIKIPSARGFQGYDRLENPDPEQIQTHETTLSTLWSHLSSEEQGKYQQMWQDMRRQDPELASSFGRALREELVREAQKRLSQEQQKK